MRRLVPLLVLAAVLAGCGSSKQAATTTTVPPRPPGDVLYQGAAWAVSTADGKATAYKLVGGAWKPDRTHNVTIDILGPKPGSKQLPRPQIAVQVTGDAALADTALWVDGKEVLTKGGGLTPDKGTVYGAPDSALTKGTHTVVAYGRTAAHGTAILWTFHV